jgi:hypothetical protein
MGRHRMNQRFDLLLRQMCHELDRYDFYNKVMYLTKL